MRPGSRPMASPGLPTINVWFLPSFARGGSWRQSVSHAPNERSTSHASLGPTTTTSILTDPVDATRTFSYCRGQSTGELSMRLFALACLLSAACNLTKFTANQTAGVLQAALPALSQENDLQLAREAAPGNLKT